MEQENKNTSYSKSSLEQLLKIFFYLLIVFLTLYFGLKILNEIKSIKNDKDTPVFNESIDKTDETIIEKDIYCIKEYNEKIGIYKNDALVYTIDKYLFTLPENDKKLLRDGIYTTDSEEFYKIIEQYYWYLKTTESWPSNDFSALSISSLTSIDMSSALIYFFSFIS